MIISSRAIGLLGGDSSTDRGETMVGASRSSDERKLRASADEIGLKDSAGISIVSTDPLPCDDPFILMNHQQPTRRSLAKRDDNRCHHSQIRQAQITLPERRMARTGRENIKNAWSNPPALVSSFPSNEVLARNAHHSSRIADTSR